MPLFLGGQEVSMCTLVSTYVWVYSILSTCVSCILYNVIVCSREYQSMFHNPLDSVFTFHHICFVCCYFVQKNGSSCLPPFVHESVLMADDSLSDSHHSATKSSR